MSLVGEFLREYTERAGLDDHGLGSRPALHVVTSRIATARCVVTLVHPEGSASPALVAKMPRQPADNPLVEREAANLRAAAEARPDWNGAIPRVLACETFRGHAIVLETALGGTRLGWPDLRRRPTRWADAALGWLLGEDGTEITKPADPEWYERLIGEPLQVLVGAVPTYPEVAHLARRTLELLSPLRDAALPLVFEHGDFNYPNFLSLPRKRLGVVDWEAAEPLGLPATDLAFMLTHVAFAWRRARDPVRQMDAFERAFIGPEPWAGRMLSDYARRLGLAPALPPLLVVACFARQCGRLAKRSLEFGPCTEHRLMSLLRPVHLPLWRRAAAAAESA
jgi:hypothetical protein